MKLPAISIYLENRLNKKSLERWYFIIKQAETPGFVMKLKKSSVYNNVFYDLLFRSVVNKLKCKLS